MARYCFGDLHGNYEVWQKIKEYIKPEDEVYCLGDCADRGKDGFKIMREVLETPNITYLKGNHEDLMIEAYYKGKWDVWFWNGGKKTKQKFEVYLQNIDERFRFLKQLKELPTRIDIETDYGKVILTHAGCNPWKTNSYEDYIWDRHHIYSPWKEDEEWKNTYIVHGHTPTMVEEWEWVVGPDNVPTEDNPRIIRYALGHKVCIDTGATWTNVAVLFNLDTFEPIYIRGDSIEEEIL